MSDSLVNTLITVLILVTAVAMLAVARAASCVPVRRATKVGPMVALRCG